MDIKVSLETKVSSIILDSPNLNVTLKIDDEGDIDGLDVISRFDCFLDRMDLYDVGVMLELSDDNLETTFEMIRELRRQYYKIDEK